MTKKQRFYFGLLIFGIALIGIIPLIDAIITLPEFQANSLDENFSADKKNVIMRISPAAFLITIFFNPLTFMLAAVVLGTMLHDKVKLDAPFLKSLFTNTKNYNTAQLLRYGVFGGIIIGILLVILSNTIANLFPFEPVTQAVNLEYEIYDRFLYGGIAEEIFMRFGIMTAVVVFISKIFKSTSTYVYWLVILVMATIYGLAQLPLALDSVAVPSFLLMVSLIAFNSIGAIVFGWLYWKQGLESAILAHITSILIILIFSFI